MKIISVLISISLFCVIASLTHIITAFLLTLVLVLWMMKYKADLSDRIQKHLPSYKRVMHLQSMRAEEVARMKRKIYELENQYGFFKSLYPLLRRYDEALNEYPYFSLHFMMKDQPEQIYDEYEYYIEFLKIGQELLYQNKVDVFDTIQYDQVKH